MKQILTPEEKKQLKHLFIEALEEVKEKMDNESKVENTSAKE